MLNSVEGKSLCCALVYILHNIAQAFAHLARRISKCDVAIGCQFLITHMIAAGSISDKMLLTIDFYSHFRLAAFEIKNETAHGGLTPEM